MLSILKITPYVVTLSYGDSFRVTYSNSNAERNALISMLNDEGQSDLWDDNILPIWGDSPTISYPSYGEEYSIEDIRKNKQIEIKQMCHDKIVEGISIDLGLVDDMGQPMGELHYSLTELNQTDMRDLVSMISQGATQVTWRDDSRVSHMIYTSEQFLSLYKASTEYILRCRFHSDGLEELLYRYTEDEKELIEALDWDTELPEDIQGQIHDLLNIMIDSPAPEGRIYNETHN